MKIAFNLLMNAGEIAEWENSNEINEKHASQAISEMEKVLIGERLREMEKKRRNELIVLKCIAELDGKQRIDSGSLFEYLKERGIKISRRSFANYINYLEKEGFIETKPIIKGRGRSREVKLRAQLKNFIR